MTRIEKTKTIKAHVPHGHGKGGQSQNRFQRLHEEAKHNYLVQVAASVKAYFDDHPVDHLLVGGPGMTKNEMIEHYLDPELKKKIIFVADTGNGGQDGFRDILYKAKEERILENTEYMKERAIIEKFIELVSKDGLVEYGEKEVMNAIEEGRVEHLIVSEKLPTETVALLTKKATETGANVSVISTSTEEGAMFAGGFTGIGAFLRWKNKE